MTNYSYVCMSSQHNIIKILMWNIFGYLRNVFLCILFCGKDNICTYSFLHDNDEIHTHGCVHCKRVSVLVISLCTTNVI